MTESSADGGSGLGPAIVKRLIKPRAASSVPSVLGAGTCIRFTLPRV
ncbi:MAG: hypothetical protein U0841_23800 [Chloroflexia bacterium]